LALVGFLLAGFWALFAVATFPSTERMRDLWTFVCITCPIAVAGMHDAISLYETLGPNAVTYALVVLIVETFRKPLDHA
jgi:predicted membrane-bound mannosyltransferase